MIRSFGIPFFAMSVGFLALFGFVLTIYVIYDVLVNQEEMQTIEKLIWIGAVLAFNIFGIVVYLILVKSQGEFIMDARAVAREASRIDELERLKELKEDGTLTEDEFQEEKERILDGDDE